MEDDMPDDASVPLIVHNQDNYGLSEMVGSAAGKKAGAIVDVTIWGGCSFNCGERSTSQLVQNHRESLLRFIYLPQSHKGGRMVRPLYDRGDRGSTSLFPALKTLGYYEDCGTPFDALWIVPNLEKLYVFQGFSNGSSTILDRWTTESIDMDQTLPLRVLEESPRLQEIIVAVPNFSQPFRFHVLRRLVPRPLTWKILRLLQLVLRKERHETCPMAMLPSALVDRIVSFCPNGHFEASDHGQLKTNSDDHVKKTLCTKIQKIRIVLQKKFKHQ